jgi:hypothetical protein
MLTTAHREQIAVDGSEIIGWAFHTLADLRARTTPGLANRVTQALTAHHTGSTLYLEAGVPLSL